jgi:hypothetical protein
MRLFKHQWITQEVIDYLMSIPQIYQILYVVRINKDFSSSFLFRDDDGKLVANLYERDVIAVRIQYQDDPFFEDCPASKILDKYSLPYMKRVFGEFMARRPTTQSNVKPKDLYMMLFHDFFDCHFSLLVWCFVSPLHISDCDRPHLWRPPPAGSVVRDFS